MLEFAIATLAILALLTQALKNAIWILDYLNRKEELHMRVFADREGGRHEHV